MTKNKEGAAQVCTSWLSNLQTTKNEKFNPRNFAKLNKWAVLDGQVTAKQNYEFRKTHDARVPFGFSALKNAARAISLPKENFTFGKPNRPQTPIDGIISNHFGQEASDQLQSRYGLLKEFKKETSPRTNNIDIR